MERPAPLVWLERGGKFLLLGWLRILPDSLLAVKWARRHPAAGLGGPAAAVWAIGKWVVPLLLGSVFVGLFALANPVVEDFVMRATSWLTRKLAELPDLFDPMRILLWAAVLAGSVGNLCASGNALMAFPNARQRDATPGGLLSRRCRRILCREFRPKYRRCGRSSRSIIMAWSSAA